MLGAELSSFPKSDATILLNGASTCTSPDTFRRSTEPLLAESSTDPLIPLIRACLAPVAVRFPSTLEAVTSE
jgi:hypothetical protein